MTDDERPTGTREQVLTLIRTAASPPTVDELATTLELHPNSVRHHAAALQRAGLIEQSSRATGTRGRPHTTYRPTTQGSLAGGRNYELLAEVLVDHIAATASDPRTAARSAGRAWGQRLTAGRTDDEGLVPNVLTELGFEPQGDDSTIELRNCPFRELVDSHQHLVCSLHAGMLDGLVDDRPVDITLTPFTTPTTCAVRMAPSD